MRRFSFLIAGAVLAVIAPACQLVDDDGATDDEVVGSTPQEVIGLSDKTIEVPEVSGQNPFVRISWGYMFNTENNHLRGWAQMVSNTPNIHVQFDSLNLGDSSGVLQSIGGLNNQSSSLEHQTDFVLCQKSHTYLVNLHYSIRWPDGKLFSGRQTGQLQGASSFICAGGAGGG